MVVRVLGPVELRRADGATVRLPGALPRALLARLTVSLGEVVPAEGLIEDLWHGRPPASADVALRVHVAKLRRSLQSATGDTGTRVLVHRNRGYTIDLDPGLVDAAPFERHVRAGLDVAAARPVTALRHVDEALRLWSGRPYGDLADWAFARPERARLEELRLLGLEERLSALLALGRHAEVLPEAATLLEEFPLRERLCGQAMLALYRSGRQAEALRSYEDHRRRLADELGLLPGPELRAVQHAVLLQQPALTWREGEPDVAVATLVPGRTPNARVRGPGSTRTLTRAGASERSDLRWATPRGAPAFVGRDPERRTLLDAARRVFDGDQRSLVLVAGEAGIGKTRLVAEVARRVDLEGALVLFGRCDEEGISALGPIVRAVEGQLAVEDGAERSDERRRLVAEMADVARALGRWDEPGEDAGVDRSPLVGALDRFFGALTQERPVLLVLDDLQWADRATLRLVRHLLRSVQPGPLLVIGTYRSTELEDGTPLAVELGRLGRSPGFELLHLGGLLEPEVLQLVTAVSGTVPERALLDTFRRHTQGNPFFVVELARHLGEVSEEGAAVPAGVRHVLEQRVRRLPPEAGTVLRVASVIGSEFDFGLLAEVAGLDEELLVGALDAALAAELLVEVPGGRERFEFPHALVRQALYDSMSRGRRARLHRRVGLALEARSPGAGSPELDALAFHLCSAAAAGAVTDDERGRAIDHARRAAVEAGRRSAWESAARHLACAVAVVERDEEAPLRCRLLVELARAHHRAGDDHAARRDLREAADLAERLDSAELLTRVALLYSGGVAAQDEVLGGDGARVLRLVDRALERVGPDDLGTRARLLARRSRWLYRSDVEERRRSSREALDLARAGGDPVLVGSVLGEHFWTLWGPDHTDERRVVADELLALGERTGNRRLLLSGAQCLLFVVAETGPASALQAAAARRDRLAAELRDPDTLYAAAQWAAVVAATEGRFDEAEERGQEARRLRDVSGPAQGRGAFAALLTQVRWLQGRLAELTEAQEVAAARASDAVSLHHASLLLMYVEGGRRAEATALLARLAADVHGIERGFDWYGVMAGLALGASELGDRAAASAVRAELAPFADRNCVAGQSAFLGAVPLHLGRLAASLDDHDGAEHHLEASLARHEELRARPFVALSQEALARTLVARDRRGDRARAAGLAEQAGCTARELGMATLLTRVTSLLARLR